MKMLDLSLVLASNFVQPIKCMIYTIKKQVFKKNK